MLLTLKEVVVTYLNKASGITEGRGDMFLRNVGYLPIKRHTKLQPKRSTLKSSPLLEFQISNSLPWIQHVTCEFQIRVWLLLCTQTTVWNRLIETCISENTNSGMEWLIKLSNRMRNYYKIPRSLSHSWAYRSDYIFAVTSARTHY